MSQWKLSVDTGGTFTDCFCETPDGQLKRLKVLSNSTLRGKISGKADTKTYNIEVSWEFSPTLLEKYAVYLYPGEIQGKIKSITTDLLTLEKPAENKNYTHFEIRSPEEVPVFAARLLTESSIDADLPPIDMRLGTTRGTNALLERAGTPVILLITKGFRDLLVIGNQQRPDLFELNIRKAPLFYERVIEVEERLDAEGNILVDLSEEECKRVASCLKSYDPSGVSVAIAFLHAYKNCTHEKKLADFLSRENFSWISYSSNLSANSKILHRAQTTVVNAYLSPIMNSYFNSIEGKSRGTLQVMTSAGHLSGIGLFTPKDGLLSGPAGGIKGAVNTAKLCGIDRMATFDMGGTSTDVSIYNGTEDYSYETSVGGAVIQAPCLAIETIAAGGGSICHFDGQILAIGPASAGAQPGPACYGAGGPLTVTDINLLAGRLHESNFSIPLSRSHSKEKLQELRHKMEEASRGTDRESLLKSLLQITTEKMAQSIQQLSIRKGVDLSSLSLVTFGGAGGQHACDLAELLSISDILIPYDAGLLSAYGIRTTEIANFNEIELQIPWSDAALKVQKLKDQLYGESRDKLVNEGYSPNNLVLKSCFLYLRFIGQESTIEVDYREDIDVPAAFKSGYTHVFGHWLENKTIEITSMKVVTAVINETEDTAMMSDVTYTPDAEFSQEMLTRDGIKKAPVFTWDTLESGAKITGPALLGSPTCTVFLNENWELVLDSQLNAHLSYQPRSKQGHVTSDPANLALFTNRFTAVVEDMGAILQRTSFSVNVKERVDFSCALLDSAGRLVVNAPHIPVHLGSMGVCVRAVMENIELSEGDVILTNHPAYGGSHLPDITLICPVYYEGVMIGVVANRAHHAEIGGKTPGSMPPDARTLEEEGIIFEPLHLLEKGTANWQEVENRLTQTQYPSRAPEENLADLRGALASIQSGVRSVTKLCALFGADTVSTYMQQLYDYAGDKMEKSFNEIAENSSAREQLDDGSPLCVNFLKSSSGLIIDFTGSSTVHSGNLNATPAIVRSVVLYIMRLLLRENLPLNEGILRDVEIVLPEGMLNPDFTNRPLPAVVGGNTEVSQRLTDTLLKALNMVACSYGTMNNILFGNERFGFYETICGGTGAGPGFNGCDAVHQHMTNTRITDPEIIEQRYPVRLERFILRSNSGGKGKWNGGSGVIRAIRFLDNVELSVLTQHRTQGPYGKKGGEQGTPGRQYAERDGEVIMLQSTDYMEIKKGDLFVIETPGGGGWGVQDT